MLHTTIFLSTFLPCPGFDIQSTNEFNYTALRLLIEHAYRLTLSSLADDRNQALVTFLHVAFGIPTTHYNDRLAISRLRRSNTVVKGDSNKPYCAENSTVYYNITFTNLNGSLQNL
jgi:hypothetical protein